MKARLAWRRHLAPYPFELGVGALDCTHQFGRMIVLQIFDERERTDDRPLARGEALFTFYDRTCRQPFVIFRHLVNEWLAAMPADAAAEIVARMRKGDDLG